MVMGYDSCSKGRGFKSQCRILDGHFFTLICCKKSIVCLKTTKKNEKEAGIGTFFLKKHLLIFQSEYSKMLLIWQLVDGNRDELPEDSITDNEKVYFRFSQQLVT